MSSVYVKPLESQKTPTKIRAPKAVAGNDFNEYCTIMAENISTASSITQLEQLPGMLSLQRPPQDMQRVWVKYGEDMLNQLLNYYKQSIGVRPNLDDLNKMQQILANPQAPKLWQGTVDELQEIVREIETRLAVEVAKLESLHKQAATVSTS